MTVLRIYSWQWNLSYLFPRLWCTVFRLSVSDLLPTTVFGGPFVSVSLSNTAHPNQGSEENLVLMLSGPRED